MSDGFRLCSATRRRTTGDSRSAALTRGRPEGATGAQAGDGADTLIPVRDGAGATVGLGERFAEPGRQRVGFGAARRVGAGGEGPDRGRLLGRFHAGGTGAGHAGKTGRDCYQKPEGTTHEFGERQEQRRRAHAC